jgi:hypothetical protein
MTTVTATVEEFDKKTLIKAFNCVKSYASDFIQQNLNLRLAKGQLYSFFQDPQQKPMPSSVVDIIASYC